MLKPDSNKKHKAYTEAMAVHDISKEYFNSSGGALEWQDHMIKRYV